MCTRDRRLYDFYDRENQVFPLGNRGVARKVGKEFEDPAEELAYKLAEKMSPSMSRERDDFDDIRQMSGLGVHETFGNNADPAMREPDPMQEVGEVPQQAAPKKRRDGEYEVEDVWVSNPNFNPEDDESSEELQVTVTYDVSGEYRDATWGYNGGDPAEEPEVEVVSVYDSQTGEDLTDLLGDSDAVYNAAHEAMTQLEPDYDGPDDDYYESVNALKRLSGLI
jgi:hypothetical protein